jgi:hypothetical protein
MVQHGAALEIRVSPWKKCLVPHLTPRKNEEKPSKSRGAQIHVINLFLKKKRRPEIGSWKLRTKAISTRDFPVGMNAFMLFHCAHIMFAPPKAAVSEHLPTQKRTSEQMNMNGAKHFISNRKPTKNSCFFRPWFTSKNVAPLIRFQATMFHREILQYPAKNADMSDPVGHHRSTNKKKVLPSNNLIWQRNILPSYPSRGEGKFPDICVNCEDAALDFQGKNINQVTTNQTSMPIFG